MKIIKVKKIFRGCISIRDYIAEKAIDKEEGLLVQYEGKEMFLSRDDLLKKRVAQSEAFLKKYRKPEENPFYRLWDYKWKPTNDLKLF